MLPGPRYHGLRGSAHVSRKPRREEATPAVRACSAPCCSVLVMHRGWGASSAPPRPASEGLAALPLAAGLPTCTGESAGNFEVTGRGAFDTGRRRRIHTYSYALSYVFEVGSPTMNIHTEVRSTQLLCAWGSRTLVVVCEAPSQRPSS